MTSLISLQDQLIKLFGEQGEKNREARNLLLRNPDETLGQMGINIDRSVLDHFKSLDTVKKGVIFNRQKEVVHYNTLLREDTEGRKKILQKMKPLAEEFFQLQKIRGRGGSWYPDPFIFKDEIERFDIDQAISLWSKATPTDFSHLPVDDLEWMLTDFVLSLGQRLPLDASSWPSHDERTRLHHFGQRYFPFSTATDFPNVKTVDLCTLALAFSYYAIYFLLLDKVIDEPTTAPVKITLALQHLLVQSQRWYQSLFPADSPFWPEVEKRRVENTQAMLEEYSEHQQPGGVNPFSVETLRQIAHKEMAVIQNTPIGLAVLNQTPEHIPMLATCWDAVGLTDFIVDDIEDWQRDYESQNFTYPLTQILLSAPFQNRVTGGGRLPTVKNVGTALFCSDVFESLYGIAFLEVNTAISDAQNNNCPALVALLQKTKSDIEQDCNTLTENKLAALLTAA